VAQFNQAIETVLSHEGGYVDHPDDPGGETKYGISKRSYPDLDIKNLTIEEAKEIYHRDFWEPIKGDSIQSQDVATNLLDYAVNAGVRRASRTIQKLTGAAQDGRIGPQTLEAISRHDGLNLNLRLVLDRVEFYTELAAKRSEFRAFLVGWIRRALSFR
jgi:lysozyme family protein